MKTRKLLQRITAFFDSSADETAQQREALEQVLAKLKRKEKKLQDKLKQAKKALDKAEIEQKLLLVHAQRSKGLLLLKELRDKEKNR